MGDRGGGREPKGASLRTSKKNPGCSAGKAKTAGSGDIVDVKSSLEPPVLAAGQYFDAGAALLSRQFDVDRTRIILRAQNDGVCGMLCWCANIQKLDEMAELAKDYPGVVYFLTGAHPDNIDKSTRKINDDWLKRAELAARAGTCLGVSAGLNMTREVSTHFLQTSLFRSSCRLAEKVGLPLVLHIASDGKSMDAALEVLCEEGWVAEGENGMCTPKQHVILYDAVAAIARDITGIREVVRNGLWCAVSANGLTDGDEEQLKIAQEVMKAIPLNRLLVCSDSPWRTPQNIPDAYVRSLRNEPSNLPFLVKAVFQILGHEFSEPEFANTLLVNSLQAFGLALPAQHGVDTAAVRDEDPPASRQKPVEKSVVEAVATAGVEQNSKTADAKEESIDTEEDAAAPETTGSRSFPAKAHLLAGHGQRDEGDEAVPDAKQEDIFLCQACRTELFKESDIHTHTPATAKSVVFRSGEEGNCSRFAFVPCEDAPSLSNHTRLKVRGGSVECSHCGHKLGRYFRTESPCACGLSVPGPVVKITMAKLDRVQHGISVEELVARSRAEADLAKHEDAMKLAELKEIEKEEFLNRRANKKTNRMAKSSNKGNFSEFRNKVMK